MKTPRHIASARAMRLFRSPAGGLLTQPWMDGVVLMLLRRYFFPLSRLWALAREAEGNDERFIAGTSSRSWSPRRVRRLRASLAHFERCRLKAYMTEQLWHDYLFGQREVAVERLLIAEEMRLDTRTAYNLTRWSFRPFCNTIDASVKMSPPTPAQVAARFGADGEGIPALFDVPASLPAVEVSRRLPVPHGNDFWLRFASPSPAMQDMVYARVHEPAGIRNPPTLIFGHGICVEFDHYHNLIDEVAALMALGIRVVRPEAPWHGRRVLPGHFGGEQLLSRTPSGMFDFLGAQHQEWAVLIDWCRRTSNGPVAIGGSSLGAQTAKSIAMHAASWPAALRPDALLAISHCSHIAETALDSSFSDIWNLSTKLKENGWNRELVRHWLLRLDAPCSPCMPPEHIISVTGSHDDVTPEASARAQLDAWQVPERNRFSYRRGHFTIPLGMIRDQAPLRRLSGVLEQCR
jgi:hypothetical protein